LIDNDLFAGLPGKPLYYYLGIYLLVSLALFHESLFSASKLIFGTDLLAGNLFFRAYLADYMKTFLAWPVWDQYIHGGMPFVDGMHGDIFYLPTFIFYMLFNIFYAWGFTIAMHVFLAGFFMYIFLKEIGVRGKIAFLFGLIYQVAPIFISLTYAGHNGKMFVIALTPLVFFIFERAMNRGKIIYYLWLAFVMYLVMTTPHMQMAYFLFMTLGFYFIAKMISKWRQEKTVPFKPFVLFAAAASIGLCLSLVQFLSPYLYLQEHSMRNLRADEGKGYEYSASWSIHYEELGSLLFPEFCGDNIQGQPPSYWGRNVFKLNAEYFSLIAFLMAVFAIGLWRRGGKWFFFWTAILTIFFALGANTPLFRLFYLVPGISNFRAPGLVLFLTSFSVITLGAMGFESLLQTKKSEPELKKTWKVYTYITIGLSVFFLLIIFLQKSFFDIWSSIFGHALDANKLAAINQSLDRVTVGAVISLVVAWGMYFMLKFYLDKKLKTGLIIGVLAAFSFIYCWQLNSRYIKTIDPEPYYAKTSIIDFFQSRQAAEPFRVLVMPQTVRDYYLAYHGVEELSISMLHGNHLATFEELAGREGPLPGVIYQSVQDLLNTRYNESA